MRDFLLVLRTRWLIILGCTLVVTGVVAFLTYRQTPIYTAQSAFYLSANPDDSSKDDTAFPYVLTPQDLARYVAVLGSPLVLEPLRERLDLAPGHTHQRQCEHRRGHRDPPGHGHRHGPRAGSCHRERRRSAARRLCRGLLGAAARVRDHDRVQGGHAGDRARIADLAGPSETWPSDSWPACWPVSGSPSSATPSTPRCARRPTSGRSPRSPCSARSPWTRPRPTRRRSTATRTAATPRPSGGCGPTSCSSTSPPPSTRSS